MLVLGILLIIIGAVGAFYGNYLNNDFEAQLSSLLDTGTANPGTVFIIGGFIAVGVGLVLLFVGLTKKKQQATTDVN